METIDARIQIPMDWIIGQIMDQVPVDRHRAMVERLGEACLMKTAAKELSVTPQTIAAMIRDGRLKSACEGTRVDVRSIADYIEKPKKKLSGGKTKCGKCR